MDKIRVEASSVAAEPGGRVEVRVNTTPNDDGISGHAVLRFAPHARIQQGDQFLLSLEPTPAIRYGSGQIAEVSPEVAAKVAGTAKGERAAK